MKLELFKLSVERLIIRFYLFMALILLGGFTNLPWSLTLLMAMVVFITGYLGVTLRDSDRSGDRQNSSRTSTASRQQLCNYRHTFQTS